MSEEIDGGVETAAPIWPVFGDLMSVLLGAFVLIHNLFMSALEQLLPSPPPLAPLDLASAVLINVAIALVLFQLLDRFKRPA